MLRYIAMLVLATGLGADLRGESRLESQETPVEVPFSGVDSRQNASQEVRVSAKPYTPPSQIVRVQSDLVEVGVVVRGKDGHAIANLKREDFEILDQGKTQAITHFAVETAATAASNARGPAAPARPAPVSEPVRSTSPTRPPRFVAIYFDNFAVAAGDLARTRTAAKRFIAEGLDTGDRAAIFSSSSGLIVEYTADRSKLLDGIGKLAPHPLFSQSGLTSCPRITPWQAYQIAVAHDKMAKIAAVDEAMACSEAPDDGTESYARRPPRTNQFEMQVESQAELTWNQVRAASQSTLDSIGGALDSLSARQGRRLLLLVSSGFLTGTLERERDELIDRALRANVIINSLDAKGLYAVAPGRPIDEILDEPAVPQSTYHFELLTQSTQIQAGTDIMAEFAESTGGLFFHNNNDLAYGFHELGAIPSVTYVLAFRPSSADGSYHKLKVRLTSPLSHVVEARPGYFAPAREAATAQDTRARFDREVAADSTVQEIPILLSHEQNNGILRIQIHIDIAGLQFPNRDARRAQQFKLVVALVDTNGDIVSAKEGTMDFALTDETFRRLLSGGVNAGFTLNALPGKYRLRAVVQEAIESKLASASELVDVQ